MARLLTVGEVVSGVSLVTGSRLSASASFPGTSWIGLFHGV